MMEVCGGGKIELLGGERVGCSETAMARGSGVAPTEALPGAS